MDISIIIPAYDEEGSIDELIERLVNVIQKMGISSEILLIDDGSTDETWGKIEENKKKHPNQVKGVRFFRNFGKSAALQCGFEKAKGVVVVTMDADLQDNPEEIPKLYKKIKEEKFHLVSGWKKERKDPLGKTIPSKLFNRVTRFFSGINLHDFNCGLKAYGQEVVKNVEVYGELHRFIPLLAKSNGFIKITEVPVKHSKRLHGKSKFGNKRMIAGFLDFLTVYFVSKYGKKPMHFFGTIGVIFFFFGGLTTSYIIIKKLFQISFGEEVRDITDQPLFYIALVAIIVGAQLFLTGYITELFLRISHTRTEYSVKKEV